MRAGAGSLDTAIRRWDASPERHVAHFVRAIAIDACAVTLHWLGEHLLRDDPGEDAQPIHAHLVFFIGEVQLTVHVGSYLRGRTCVLSCEATRSRVLGPLPGGCFAAIWLLECGFVEAGMWQLFSNASAALRRLFGRA